MKLNLSLFIIVVSDKKYKNLLIILFLAQLIFLLLIVDIYSKIKELEKNVRTVGREVESNSDKVENLDSEVYDQGDEIERILQDIEEIKGEQWEMERKLR